MKYFVVFLILIGLVIQLFGTSQTFAEPVSREEYSLGKVEWLYKCHPLVFNMGTIRVIDHDMNLDDSMPDKFDIEIFSDYNENNIQQYVNPIYTVIEDGNSTGVFESIIFWGDPHDEGIGHRVPIWHNTTVTAKYVDFTLPSSYLDLELEITSSMIVKDVKPIEKKNSNGITDFYYVYEPCTIELWDMKKDPKYDVAYDFIFPSPLKQIKSGLTTNEIQCKENLILLQKYDGSPACVTEQTKQKLIERGWTNAELDTYLIKYSPVLFSGTGVDLQEDDLIEHLKNKREQLHIALDEIGVKGLYPITGMSFSVGHNAYSLDEKYVGNPVALEINVLKEEFTKETLVEVNQLVRKYVGDEIDIVYSKGNYAYPVHSEIVEKIGDAPRASDTMRVGIPFLAIDPRSNTPDKYHEVKAENYAWIQRLLTDGETIVNVKELDEYFSIVDTDDNPRFGVTMNDGAIEYFTIDFYEVQNFDLDRHYIKVYPLYDQPTKNLRTLDQESSSWMTDLSKNRFNWVLVDDATYNKYVGQTLDGKQFNILTAKGDFENVELRYAGANSEVKPNLHLLYDEEIEN